MKPIPFSPPDISEQEINEVADALRSGWITTGARTKEFEKRIATYTGAAGCACLNSATAAMECILRVLGVGPGDEVITSAYTYTATASVTLHVGAKLILVDCKKDSFEIDYDQVKDKINENTKVIMPVDIGGRMCDYDKLFDNVQQKAQLFHANNEIQKAFNRPIILADSAHGFGASRNGIMSGNAADFTAFSFHAVKNLTTGEGGAVTWRQNSLLDNEAIYKQFMLQSLHGQSKDAFSKNQLGAWEYDIVSPAYKCNMTDINAAIGLIQLKRYPDLLAIRKKIIEIYDNKLLPLGIERLVHFEDDIVSSGHLFLLRIPGIEEDKRNVIIQRMAEKGIATNVHYKPLPMMTAYKNIGFKMKDFPNAFNQYKNEITLPLYSRLTEDEAEYVADSITEIIKEIR